MYCSAGAPRVTDLSVEAERSSSSQALSFTLRPVASPFGRRAATHIYGRGPRRLCPHHVHHRRPCRISRELLPPTLADDNPPVFPTSPSQHPLALTMASLPLNPTPHGVESAGAAVPPALPPAPGAYRPHNEDLPSLRHLLHPWHGLPPPARTRAEQRGLAFERAIKEQTGWVDKVSDDSLVERWAAQALATTSARDEKAGGASGVSDGGGDRAATDVHEPPPLTVPMLAAAVAQLRADAA